MYTVAAQRHIFLALIAVLALVIMVSCTEDERDPDAPSGTGSGTPPGDFIRATPDGEPTDSLVTPEVGNATPDGQGLPDPQATGTPLDLAERTVTPGASTTGPVGTLFPDITTQGPELENYTLTLVAAVVSTDEAQQGQPTDVDLKIEQSAPETFYLFFDGADEFVVEVWSVDEQIWIREEEGEIEEASQEFEDAFDVGVYLSILPDVAAISEAEEVGEEEIEGRTATHYTVAAENAVAYLPSADPAQVQDPQGSIDIWLDEEANVILRMTVDLNWLDAEGSENSHQSQYNITAIGETDEIEVPNQ